MSKELTINNHIYEAKGTFAFSRQAKKYAENEADKGQSDGVTTIFMGLLQLDPEYLVKFWHCATAHNKESKLAIEDIEAKIEEIAEQEGDLTPYFKSALEVLNEGGYFKGKFQNLWFMMNNQIKKQKGEEKEKTQAQIEMLKEMYKNTTGKAPFGQ